ncbi:hypothetical protein JTE90_009980 [Oedothorax gibbosus]|uniref:Cystathionine beta-synthase n=1 Tax=Oedothorax gibbosus TaxID=931172 RepID=A0AAV6UE07_9ARAC|nr:hypothetical protein JTE90_009980 [Oedothorax gibbosus]
MDFEKCPEFVTKKLMNSSPTKSGIVGMSSASMDFVPPDRSSQCTWHLGDTTQNSVHNHVQRSEKPKIYPDALYAVGNTPLIRLNKIPLDYNIKCDILVKCEFLNVGGSVKDRIAVRMIEEAENSGKIKPGYTLIEPSSGNTGIGIALAAAVKGYKCIVVMPEKMSIEKVDTIKALGADIIRTPTSARFNSPESYINVAQRVQKQIPNSFILNQYQNAANALEHYDSTAEEILDACDNQVDMIVMGVGTGGTITGIGRKVKERCPTCQIVGVDPYGSILAQPEILNETTHPGNEMEGIGKDFIPTVLDRTVVDKWYKSEDKESFHLARLLIKKEGLLCGGSSGSALAAALKAAKDLKEGQRCVVILPDGLRNYMTKFLSDKWMAEKNLIDTHSETNAKDWWGNLKISCLNLTVPLTILPNASCQFAIDLMNKEGYEQLPVVDETGEIKGMISFGNLTAKINAGKVTSSALVSDVLYPIFHKITLNSTLGNLSTLLETSHYALVVADQRQCVETKNSVETKQIVIGIVTWLDLINFISTEEEKTRKGTNFQNGPAMNGY